MADCGDIAVLMRLNRKPVHGSRNSCEASTSSGCTTPNVDTRLANTDGSMAGQSAGVPQPIADRARVLSDTAYALQTWAAGEERVRPLAPVPVRLPAGTGGKSLQRLTFLGERS